MCVLADKMAGAGGKSMGAYDYLIKLMLIGDSGEPQGQCCGPPGA